VPPEASRPKIEVDVDPKFKEGKYIDVSIDNQIMALFEDGIKTYSFLYRAEFRTFDSAGIYNIQRKEIIIVGIWTLDALQPEFFGPYYIHELPYWPSGFREGKII